MDILIEVLTIAFILGLLIAVIFLGGRLVVWFFLPQKKGDQQ